jgi:hypothetical protein
LKGEYEMAKHYKNWSQKEEDILWNIIQKQYIAGNDTLNSALKIAASKLNRNELSCKGRWLKIRREKGIKEWQRGRKKVNPILNSNTSNLKIIKGEIKTFDENSDFIKEIMELAEKYNAINQQKLNQKDEEIKVLQKEHNELQAKLSELELISAEYHTMLDCFKKATDLMASHKWEPSKINSSLEGIV